MAAPREDKAAEHDRLMLMRELMNKFHKYHADWESKLKQDFEALQKQEEFVTEPRLALEHKEEIQNFLDHYERAFTPQDQDYCQKLVQYMPTEKIHSSMWRLVMAILVFAFAYVIFRLIHVQEASMQDNLVNLGAALVIFAIFGLMLRFDFWQRKRNKAYLELDAKIKDYESRCSKLKRRFSQILVHPDSN
ncbi:MAG: hypothetical protein K6F05_08405 [Succinivibrio sp.]|nr:hypothetical protein [Succinivibrio sp.]